MFLKMPGMAVTGVARAPQPRGSSCKSHCFYCVLLQSLLPYLPPAMLTNPAVATGGVRIDRNGLC